MARRIEPYQKAPEENAPARDGTQLGTQDARPPHRHPSQRVSRNMYYVKSTAEKSPSLARPMGVENGPEAR